MGQEADDIVKCPKKRSSVRLQSVGFWEEINSQLAKLKFKETILSGYKAQFSVWRHLRVNQVRLGKCFYLNNKRMSETDTSFLRPSHSKMTSTILFLNLFPLSILCLSLCAFQLFNNSASAIPPLLPANCLWLQLQSLLCLLLLIQTACLLHDPENEPAFYILLKRRKFPFHNRCINTVLNPCMFFLLTLDLCLKLVRKRKSDRKSIFLRSPAQIC